MDEILADASKFSVYDDLKAKLMAKGIPETEIRFIHEAHTDAQKSKLFEEVNQGKVRVLLPGLSKDAAGQPVPGDMLIFTTGHPPIYGRQILYFIDPVFSARAKVKAPGVAEGWSRGLSDSLHFEMPLITGSSQAAPAETITAEPEAEGDLTDEYKKLLDA